MTGCGNWWHNNTVCIEHALLKVFRKWGLFVAHHPLITIILSIIIGGILNVFILFIESETKLERLYAPQGTITWNNYQKYRNAWDLYEDSVGFNHMIVYDKNNASKNILSMEYLLLFQEIYDDIISIEIEDNNIKYKYDDICYKLENGNCETSSILELFHYNKSLIKETFNSTLITYPVMYSSYSGKPLFLPLVLGQDITTISSNISTTNDVQIITGSPAFYMNFLLDIGYYDDGIAKKWYIEYLNVMKYWSLDKNNLFSVTYESYSSLADDINRSISSDTTNFVVGIVSLFIFTTMILLRFKRKNKCFILDSKRNRARIGWIGILSSILAIGASFGFVGGILRIKFNSVVSIAPFLLIGLGLDDMFVLLRAYELTPSSLSIPERMALTMERGGVSILFTSITDLVAFCIGSSSAFGAISAFCVYCGVGVFMDFIFQVTFFLGFMVYDSRWQQTASCTRCCCEHLAAASDNEVRVAVSLQTKSTTKTVESAEVSTTETKSPSKPDITANKNASNMIESEANSYLMDKLGIILLHSKVSKCIVIFVFIIYLIGATIGILQLHAYQSPYDMVPNGSYIIPLYNAFERYFTAIGIPVQFILDKPLDYSDHTVLDEIDDLVEFIRNDECFADDPEYTNSWIHDYNTYLLQEYDGIINKTMFYDILYNEYLISSSGKAHIQNIWNTIVTQEIGFSTIDNETDDIFGVDVIGSSSYVDINSSRIILHLEPMGRDSRKLKDCVSNWQNIQNNYDESLGVYYYIDFGIFYEADLITIQQTTFNLLYACIAACIITLILIPYPLMTLIVITTLAQILYGILGYLSLWGLPINTTTMIGLVISVGFSVDNVAHFCHGFINAPITNIDIKPKNERYIRVKYALNSVGMPILFGDLSTIVALLPLAFAQSPIFITFWKSIFLTMLFGIAHAVCYLPVILSICGPIGFN